jgi:hypothetical protein
MYVVGDLRLYLREFRTIIEYTYEFLRKDSVSAYRTLWLPVIPSHAVHSAVITYQIEATRGNHWYVCIGLVERLKAYRTFQ